MLFRDLAIWVGEAARMPAGQTSEDFLALTYHVRESFLICLIRELDNQHFLPDAAKLNVTFGPDKIRNDYSCSLSIAHWWINEIDFGEFFSRDADGQDQWILGHVHDAFAAVADRQGVSREVVDRAVARTNREGLELRYVARKLSKLHPSRKLRFNVVRSIQREGESWDLEVCDRDGQVFETFPILENTNAVHAGYNFRKARWRGDVFLLTDAGGRIKFQKSAKRLIQKYSK